MIDLVLFDLAPVAVIEPPRFDAVTLLQAAALQARRPVCVGHRVGEERCTECRLGRSFLWADLARAVGVDEATPRQWADRGGLDDRRADEYATRLGLLPENVWPDYLNRCLDFDEERGAVIPE